MLSFLAPTCQVVEETASPPTPLQGERGVDGLAALFNRPHPQPIPASPPTPLRGERGVDSLAALVVINAILGYYFFLQVRILFFVCNLGYYLLAMSKQGYSLPSPLGEGLGVRLLVGWGEAGMGWG